MRKGILGYAAALALGGGGSDLLARVADPARPPCCFTNPQYAGVCSVAPAEGETCAAILAYLNNPQSQGKSYCGNTTIRGGWKLRKCAKPSARVDGSAGMARVSPAPSVSGTRTEGRRSADCSDPSQCAWTISFRGIGSSDPDSDITSWSLDFGDGTSVSGSWSTAPPTEVAHEYLRDPSAGVNCGGVGNFGSNVCLITLTVTDSAGQSNSQAMVMGFVDQTPD